MYKLTMVAITLLAVISCNENKSTSVKSKHEITMDSLNRISDSLDIIIAYKKTLKELADSVNSAKRIKAENNPNYKIVEYKGRFVIMNKSKNKFLILWRDTKDYSFESFVGNLILDSKEECIEHILQAEYLVERDKYKKEIEKNIK